MTGRLTAALGVMAVLGASVGGCSSPTASPTPDPALERVPSARPEIVAALAAVQADAPNASVAVERAAARTRELDLAAPNRPSGLPARLELLAATAEVSRAARLVRLEELRDDVGDPLLDRRISHQLERDDAYLAEELSRDATYTQFAGLFNGVMEMGHSALVGNPVGVMKPVVEGVQALADEDDLDARDRKRIALHRRWLRRHPDGAGLPEGAEGVQQNVEELFDTSFRIELALIDELLEEGRVEAAAAHLHVARTYQPRAEELAVNQARVAAAREEREVRRAERVQIDPLERDLSPTLAPAYVEALTEVALWGAMETSTADALIQSDPGVDLEAALARCRSRESGRPDPYRAVDDARAARRSATRRWILTGDEPASADPRARYARARQEVRTSPLDFFAPLYWLPATMFRTGYAAFANPVNDDPIVDSLARFVWEVPDDPRRADVLGELSRRYRARGEDWKALASARAAPLSDAQQRSLAEAAGSRYLRRLESSPVAIRRRGYPWLIEHLPDTEAAAEAERSLAALPTTEDSPVLGTVPLTAFRDPGGLGIPALWRDGDRENGEIDPPRIQIRRDELVFLVREGDELREEHRAIRSSDRPALDALAAEWIWRRRAARVATYDDLHDGIPIELAAGLDPASGFSILPKLLKEGYDQPDRVLYE